MARPRGVILWVALPAALAAGGLTFWLGDGREPPATYRLARAERGALTATVSATGTVNPVTTVLVGSQLSGQIRELLADYNTAVKAGDVIARIDDEQLRARGRAGEADLAEIRARLETARAQVERARAELDAARAGIAAARAQVERADSQFAESGRDRQRKRDLGARGASTQADVERADAAFDQARAAAASARAQEEGARAALIGAQANLRVMETQIAAAEAQVRQREAALEQINVDLAHAQIRAPIDGVVIQRSVDVGQTVAASLQAPTLFTIAQDLRQIEVWAAVDEGDVGRVQTGQEAQFTVNAFPGTTFRGEVLLVRLGPQTVQNVVTYTVVIAAENRDQRLLPGMTATVRIVSDRRGDALKVPNAALRWRPAGAARLGIDAPTPSAGPGQGAGAGFDQLAATLTRELALDEEQQKQVQTIADEARRQARELRTSGLPPDQLRARFGAIRRQTDGRVAALLKPEQQAAWERWRAARAGGASTAAVAGRVWVVGDDGQPRAVAVRLGIGDGAFTEIIGGDLAPGQELIVGGGPRVAASPSAAAPGPRFGF